MIYGKFLYTAFLVCLLLVASCSQNISQEEGEATLASQLEEIDAAPMRNRTSKFSITRTYRGNAQ